VRARGEDTPSEHESLEEDEEDEEEEGEVTEPSHSSLREALPSLGDIFHRQTGVAVITHQSKQTQTEIRLSNCSLSQLCLALESPSFGSLVSCLC
jgi:hypothetical protein